MEPGPRFSRARGGIAHFTEIVRTGLAAPLFLWRRRDCRAPRGASGPGKATARKRRALGLPFKVAAGPDPLSRPKAIPGPRARERSEEHTSELQSLMRISYAVFCLKKKNQTIYQLEMKMYMTDTNNRLLQL